MNKIIKRAGVEPWPKTFQNLRSTRETELFKMTNGNIKAVCSWIGNTPEVAMKHYAQVTEADLKEAALDKNRQAISFVLKRPKEEGVLFTSVFGEHALFTNLLSANFAFKDIKNKSEEFWILRFFYFVLN